MEEIKFECVGVHPEDTGRYYVSRDKKRVYISKHDMELIYRIQKLPVELRVKIADLTEVEMLEEINASKEYTTQWLTKLLEMEWYFRETGDRAYLSKLDSYYLPQKTSVKSLKEKLKRGTIALNEIEEWIKFFLGEKSEFYSK